MYYQSRSDAERYFKQDIVPPEYVTQLKIQHELTQLDETFIPDISKTPEDFMTTPVLLDVDKLRTAALNMYMLEPDSEEKIAQQALKLCFLEVRRIVSFGPCQLTLSADNAVLMRMLVGCNLETMPAWFRAFALVSRSQTERTEFEGDRLYESSYGNHS
jgi:hypothetical protein